MQKCLLIAMVLCTLLFSCGELPEMVRADGGLDIRVLLHKSNRFNNNQTRGTRATTWDRLVVQVTATDIGTIMDTLTLDGNKSLHSLFLNKIPKGQSRVVTIWTIDSEGIHIHGKKSITTDIVAGETAILTFELVPIRGSLFIELAAIPSNIDSITASFTTADTVWEDRKKRGTKVSLSIDKVPFDTTGTIIIAGLNENKDTVTSWKLDNFTFKDQLETIEVSFVTVGKIHMKITLKRPGITLFYGIMDTLSALGDEKGGLILSEIMFNSTGSDYIEIYNPSNEVFHDSILVQRDADKQEVFMVNIPAKGFYVIGEKEKDWTDTTTSSASLLSLSSTGGWVIIKSAKDSSVIDAVVYHRSSSFPEWPYFGSGIISISIDSLSEDPEYNNFGRHWYQVNDVIADSVPDHFGTPGRH